jgi:aspartate/methionine/tyrosine aminotransferase
MKTELSPTIAISNQAHALRREGKVVYDFSAGDPTIANHPLVIESFKSISPHSPYPPTYGITELRKEAADWVGTEAENVLVTPGGKFALFAALNAILKPGDTVIVVKPYWPSYPSLVELAGGKVIFVDNLEINLPPARAIIFNNPVNPTGKLYDRQTIDLLTNWSQKHNAYIISDEVYNNLIFTDRPYVSCPISEKNLIVQSLSKNFAMAGYRIGFLFADAALIKECGPLLSQTITSTSIISQWGALAALKHRNEILPYVKNILAKRRAIFIKTFEKLFGSITPPEAAIYYFCSLESLGAKQKDDLEFCRDLLDKVQVALVPGVAFGKPGFVRFAFVESEESIEKGLTLIKEYVQR